MKQDYWDQILWETARKDPDYQTLLLRCRDAEAEYLKVLSCLSPEQQARVEDYIALCEELQHRMTQLACDIPRQ